MAGRLLCRAGGAALRCQAGMWRACRMTRLAWLRCRAGGASAKRRQRIDDQQHGQRWELHHVAWAAPSRPRAAECKPAPLFYLRRDPSCAPCCAWWGARRFYFRRLLSDSQRGRAGRRAACSYVLLRNSFSGKWGSFAQQRPLALSSVRRLQRPPTNVTVRCQDALAVVRKEGL